MKKKSPRMRPEILHSVKRMLHRAPELVLTIRVSLKTDRMDCQRMDKKANVESLERSCLKVTTEKLTDWTLSRREKPPKTSFLGRPILFYTAGRIFSSSGCFAVLFFLPSFSFAARNGRNRAPQKKRLRFLGEPDLYGTIVMRL